MDRSVAQFWNTSPPDHFEKTTIRSGRMPAIARMSQLACPYITQTNSVTVDLGCGTGLFAKTLSASRIYGVDISEAFLLRAREHMAAVVRQSVVTPGLKPSSVDHVISLFVIDDYPADTKRAFFTQVWGAMRQGGYFFFAAYSPNDERMGTLKHCVNRQTGRDFTIYLESCQTYAQWLESAGFIVKHTEILRASGEYGPAAKAIPVQREFSLLVAQKSGNSS